MSLVVQDLREMRAHPSPMYTAQPLEGNMLEWHFTMRGPPDTEFAGGVYHGRIVLPPEYPFKPPNIMLLTPNGRFEIRKMICLSISAFHPETWQPAWGIRLILEALISFMPSPGEGAIGALDMPAADRRVLAEKSSSWECPVCGPIKDVLLPLPLGAPAPVDAAMAAEIAKMHMHAVPPASAGTPAASADSDVGAVPGASGGVTEPFVNTPYDPFWSPPFPVKAWRPRPDSLLTQAGASAESRRQSKLSAQDLVLELLSSYFRQVAHGGLAAQLAEEISWQVKENPVVRFALVREGIIERTLDAIHEHSTFPKVLMSLCAVLGAVGITPEARTIAYERGGVDLLTAAVVSHATHDGLRAWACGCLTNLLQCAPSQVRFEELGGLSLLITVLKNAAASEESPVPSSNDMSNDLIGTAGSALRVAMSQPQLMAKAVDLNVVECVLCVLILRGHSSAVRECMLGCVKDVCAYGGYRHLWRTGRHDGVYTVVTTVVKHCAKKIRTPAPSVEGLLITHDRAMRQALLAIGYMYLDGLFSEQLIEYGVTELVVQVLRNVTSRNSTAVQLAAACAVMNGSLRESTRQELVACGAVLVMCQYGEQVLGSSKHPSSDPAFSCLVLATCMGALAGLAMSPDAVTSPSDAALLSLEDASMSVVAASSSIMSSTASVRFGGAGAGAGVGAGVGVGGMSGSLSSLPSVSTTSVGSGMGMLPPPREAPPDLRGKLARTPSKKPSVRFSTKPLGPASPLPLPADCAMVTRGVPLMIDVLLFARQLSSMELLRAAVQALGNLCVLPWAQSAVVSLGAVPLVCSLLEDYWDVPPVVNAVACTLANFARTNEPSFRPLLYELTHDTRRVIRVMYSNIDNPNLLEHCFTALANMWLAASPAEQVTVIDAMTVASSMQSLHTILRQRQSQSGVQVTGYKALRHLACLGNAEWASEVGKVFLGPLVAVMRLLEDDPNVQEACANCLAVLCRSAPNRAAAATRDASETVVTAIRTHLQHIPAVTACMTALAQLSLGLIEHPEQGGVPALQAALLARATHPTVPAIEHWVLAMVNCVAQRDDSLSVWIGRQSEGMPLLLEARRLRLKGVFHSEGPGFAPQDVCIEVCKAKMPS